MVLFPCCRLRNKQAGMAELADALASGASGGNPVEVQFLLPAPNFSPQQSHNFAVVAERQTRQLEGLVRETSCGFKSRQPHQLSKHAGKSERARQQISYAGMAELADALASGASGGNPVEVQVLLPAPFKSEHTVKAVCFFLYVEREMGRRAAAAFHCMMLDRTRLWFVLASPEELKTSKG